MPACRVSASALERHFGHAGSGIVAGAETNVIELLERERSRLEAMARAPLESETLDQPEAHDRAGVELPRRDAEPADAHTGVQIGVR